MTTDLDELLRDTFAGRAASVASGPQWQGPPQRHRRPGLVAAAAAAVAVLAAGGAWLGVQESRTPAGSDAPSACRATLPAAWRSAVGRPGLQVDGHPVTPVGIDPGATVVGTWTGTDHVEHVVVVPRHGAAREVYRAPAGQEIVDADTDGRVAALALVRRGSENDPDPAIDLVVVDLTTGAHSMVDPSAGQVLGRHPRVMDGIVYFLAGPRGATDSTVWTWTPATRTEKAIGRTDDHAELDRDVRGVSWPGGSVPAAHVPDGLPAAFGPAVDGTRPYQAVHSDGATTAWTDRDSPFVVHWSDGHVARTFRVDLVGGEPYTPGVLGVAGRFVFLEPNESAGVWLLDTRSGAYAPLDPNGYGGPFAANGYYAYESADVALVGIDTATLPDLHC
jgi:hypothetical protein